MCRVADWPWLSLQRKASTMSVSCATRCSTPRPSSSVTSSSTASRAWAAPSSVPCASQVSVPGGEHVGRGKGPGGPAASIPGPQHLAQRGPGAHGEAPEGSAALLLRLPPHRADPGPSRLRSLLSPLRQRGFLALLPPLHSTATTLFPTQPCPSLQLALHGPQARL